MTHNPNHRRFNDSKSGGVQFESLDEKCEKVFKFSPSGQLTAENLQTIENRLGNIAERLAKSESDMALASGDEYIEARQAHELAEATIVAELYVAESLCRKYLGSNAEEKINYFRRIAWSLPNPK